MKTLIIYYSEGETTRIVSETLSSRLKADIIRINDLKKRNGFKNTIISSLDALREIKTKIKPMRVDVSEYDVIYYGTPTWAKSPSPAIITIIDRCDLRRKDVVLFATMNSNGASNAIKRMKEKVEARGARVVEHFTLKTKNKNSRQLKNEVNSIIEILDLKLYSEVD